MTLLLTIFAILFVAIGSVCAADSNGDVISNKNLNSEIANSNGIDNSDNVIIMQGSQISVDSAKETTDSKIVSQSAGNVKESSETKDVNTSVEPSNDVKEKNVITSVGASSSTVTVAQVITAAGTVKTYVEKNHAMPSSITVGSLKLTVPKFAYLESIAVQLLNSGKSTSTKISILSISGSSSTYSINKNPTKAAYVSAAKSISDYCKSKKVAPAYVTISSAKADTRVYTYAFAKILVYYKNNKNKLPNTCTFNSSVFKKVTPAVENYTISQIMAASTNVKNYVEKNKALPSTVTVGSKSISVANYSYLAAMAVQYLKSGKSTSTKINALNATGNSAKYSINEDVYTNNYVNAAKSVSSAISSKGAAPAYVAVPTSKADFRVYTYGFAKILNYYKNNKALPNYCRFNSTAFKDPTPKPVENYTISQIMAASTNVKNYVEKNKALPSTVTVGSKSISVANYSYLAAMAVQYLKSGKSTSTKINALNATGNSAKYSINEDVYTNNYVNAAKSVSSAISSKGAAPAYVAVPTSKADFRVYTYGFAKILNYYKNNKALPNYCRFNSTAFSDPTPKGSYTISQIMTASTNVKNYVENNLVLPSTVTVGSDSLPVAKYSYLAAMAVQYLKSGKSTSTLIKAVNATGNSATYSINEDVYTNNYVNAAKSVSSAISSKGAAPAYVAVPTSKADFRVYTYGFAKILNYYKNNNALPNYCRFNSTAFIITPTTNTTFTYNQIISAAEALKDYVDVCHSLPTYVEIGSYAVTAAQFSYLEATLIKELNAGKTSGSIKFVKVATPSDINKTVNINPAKSAYVAAATTVSDSSKEKSTAPSSITISKTTVPFKLYTYAFAKILVWYNDHNKTLPATCTFNSSVFSSTSKVPTNLRYSKGINEHTSAIDKATYLKISGHCAANTPIKELALSLTKNCKNDWDKATALFNYVRDNIAYSSYFNSVYDATGTLARKSANCCDQANLLVSLCRSAGLACRYCHGNPCYFRSGLTVGHVWAQIYIESSNEGPVWVAADPVSASNGLGYIVNWNGMGTLNQYALLPF